VRELYAIGRVDVPKPLTAAEIAAKFGVSHMTIRRIVAMHELELEARRKAQQCDSSASSSASTSARSS
jgi:DeoR/GlpR family transcriptional regulator of sugar metabolism